MPRGGGKARRGRGAGGQRRRSHSADAWESPASKPRAVGRPAGRRDAREDDWDSEDSEGDGTGLAEATLVVGACRTGCRGRTKSAHVLIQSRASSNATGGLRFRGGRVAIPCSGARRSAASRRALASKVASLGVEESEEEDEESDSDSSGWAVLELDEAAMADYAANAGVSDSDDEAGPSKAQAARIAALALGGEGQRGAPRRTRFLDGDDDFDEEDGSSDESDEEVEEDGLFMADDMLRATGIGSAQAGGSAPTGWQWSTQCAQSGTGTGTGTGSAAKKKKPQRPVPGEKARLRKEGIAAKRAERAVDRGFNPASLADAMRGFIAGQGDMMAMKPAGKFELKITAALASLHGLRCTVQGSGKKRFAVLTMTRQAAVVDSQDPRLLQLLSAGGMAAFDDGEEDGRHQRRRSSTASKSNKRRQEAVPLSSSVPAKGSGRKAIRRSSIGSVAAQRVAFVSGGRIGGDDRAEEATDVVEVTAMQTEVVVEMAPVAPVPKNRGERRAQEAAERERMKLERRRQRRQPRDEDGMENQAAGGLGFSGPSSAPAHLHGEWGAWERSTTGIGSKLLAKMGYKEGAGLGADGQGRAEPILVTRRPKAAGLGS